MRCAKCQKLHDNAVRATLPDHLQRKVREHIESCPACAVYWQENASLRLMLREAAAPRAMPTADYFGRLAKQAVARVEQERKSAAAVRARPGLLAGLGALLGGGQWRLARLGQAAALLVVGAVVGALLVRGLEGKPLPFGMSGGVAKVHPTPAALDWLLPREMYGQPDRTMGTPLMREAPFDAAVMKNPDEVAGPARARLASLPPGVLSVDPGRVIDAWQDTMALMGKMGPSEEVEQLRRLREMSSQINVAPMLARIQDAKDRALRRGETDDIWLFHEIESVLNQWGKVTPGIRKTYLPQLDTYQQAERALADKRYEDAMRLFQMVGLQEPKSYLAARARYQMGNVNFQYFRDYENALFDYKQCLEEFPPHYLSEPILTQIHQRIDLIAQNSADRYGPLKLVHAAEASKEAAGAVAHYAELLKTYPQSPLARSAVEAMTRLAQQNGDNAAVVGRVLEVLDEFQEKNPGHPARQHAQLACADITLYPVGNRAQAKLDYEKLLREAKEAELIEALRDRVRRVEREP